MALIKCPECAKEISDRASACPNCGYGLKEYFEATHIDEVQVGHIEMSKKKRKKIFYRSAIIVAIVAVIAIASVVLVNNFFIPESKYKEAKELLKNRKDHEAYGVFLEIKDYKDVPQILDRFEYLLAKGEGQTYIYDDALNLIREEGKTPAMYTYDADGNCIKKETNYEDSEDKVTIEYLYDSNGTCVQETSKFGSNENVIQYDTDGRCIKTYYTYYSGGTETSFEITYEYAENGNLICSYVDSFAGYSAGERWTYLNLYDKKGNVISSPGVRLPGKNTDHYVYDSRGNCIRCEVNGSVFYECEYDSNDRLIRILPSEEAMNIGFPGMERCEYKYDEHGNLLEEIKYKNSEAHVTKYVYDDRGNCIKKTVNGEETVYEYKYYYNRKK